MQKAEEFLKAYKELEANVREAYHLEEGESIVTCLKWQRPYSAMRDDIQCMANLRNYYSHNEVKRGGIYIAQPDQSAIDFVRGLNERILKRPKCGDICIPFSRVYWRSPNDSVRESMRVMQEKLYTHVPILENGIVKGVFDENSLFSFIASDEEGIFELSEETTFADLHDHLKLAGRDMEEFAFLSMRRYAMDAEELFEASFSQGRRLGMILLTANGRPDEPLQGILTPWDVLGKE